MQKVAAGLARVVLVSAASAAEAEAAAYRPGPAAVQPVRRQGPRQGQGKAAEGGGAGEAEGGGVWAQGQRGQPAHGARQVIEHM